MNKQFAFIVLLAFVGYAHATCSTGQDNCVTCSDNTRCSTCIDGYFIDNGVCQKCTLANCIACSQGDTCDTCAFGYTQYSTECKKTPCSAGQLNCKNCDASPSTNCATCDDGFWLDGNTKICSEGVCTTNCITCESASTCKTCANGYPLNANGTCGATSSSAIPATFFAFLYLALLI